MILSLQGCMAVGKTAAVRYLQENAPYVNISYEINTDIIDEVKRRQLDKNKYEDYIVEQKRIINIFGIEIYIQKETQVKKEIKPYTEEEIHNLIDNKLNETLSHTLQGEYKIIKQNTLKKYTNNSKIELEIFIVAEEQISTISK